MHSPAAFYFDLMMCWVNRVKGRDLPFDAEGVTARNGTAIELFD